MGTQGGSSGWRGTPPARTEYSRASTCGAQATTRTTPPNAPAANDDAMDVPTHADSDGPVPAGALCARCRYELAGLEPTGVCPECGLDVATSWPAWDLRRGEPEGVEDLRAEVSVLLVLAAMVGVQASVAAVAAVIELLPVRANVRGDASAGVGVVFAIVTLGVLYVLTGVLRVVRPNARGPVAHGNPARRAIVMGTIMAGAGMVATLVAGPVFSMFFAGVSVPLLVVAVAAWLLGLLILYGGASTHAQQTLQRAGVAERRTLLEEAPGLLPVAGIALVPIAAIGLVPWPAVWAAVLVGVALGQTALVLRCWRAQRALDGLAAPRS